MRYILVQRRRRCKFSSRQVLIHEFREFVSDKKASNDDAGQVTLEHMTKVPRYLKGGDFDDLYIRPIMKRHGRSIL